MKVAVVFAALLVSAVAGFTDSKTAEILRSDSDIGPEYHRYGLETTDGIKIESQGVLVNAGTDHEFYKHQGSYSFIADDGIAYTVTYIADENGFRPQGAHLPGAPQSVH